MKESNDTTRRPTLDARPTYVSTDMFLLEETDLEDVSVAKMPVQSGRERKDARHRAASSGIDGAQSL